MNEDFQIEQDLIDEEIKKVKLEQQIFAYKSQLFEIKKKLLEIKKNEKIFLAQQNELNQKINDIEKQL